MAKRQLGSTARFFLLFSSLTFLQPSSPPSYSSPGVIFALFIVLSSTGKDRVLNWFKKKEEPKEEEAVEVAVDEAEPEMPPLEQDTENMAEETAAPAPSKPRFKSLTTQLGGPAEEPAPPPAPAPEPAPEAEEAKKPVKRKLKKAPEAPEPEPILFHGPTPKEDNSQNYSNESSHPILIDDVNYKTVEHYVQSQKAKLFNDQETYEKILKKAKTASSAKKFGEDVRDFKTEIWETKQDEIMEIGVRAKFVQHPSLRKQLTETGDKVIGDADARDFYWGIGSGAALEKAKTPSKWKGMNKMGKLLMKIR
jgi:ribA/ribD-fused uncharacterized protein